jgi:hypothetical protein
MTLYVAVSTAEAVVLYERSEPDFEWRVVRN